MNNLCVLKRPCTSSLKYYTVSILFNSSSSYTHPIQGHAGVGRDPEFLACRRKSERTPGSPGRTDKPQTEPPAGWSNAGDTANSHTTPPKNILSFLSTWCSLIPAVTDILHYFKWISILKSSLQYSDMRNYLNSLFKTNYWTLIRKTTEIRNQFKLCNKFKGMNQKHLKQQINGKMHTWYHCLQVWQWYLTCTFKLESELFRCCSGSLSFCKHPSPTSCTNLQLPPYQKLPKCLVPQWWHQSLCCR